MRVIVSHVSITTPPDCPTCGAPTDFTHNADIARDGRVYLIFRCTACAAGETKVWRPEWQELTHSLVAEEL
jgi:hypothetical protein